MINLPAQAYLATDDNEQRQRTPSTAPTAVTDLVFT
jgi:hypothetical protein